MAKKNGKAKARGNNKQAQAPNERRVLNVFEVDLDAKVKHQRDSNLDEVERSKYDIDEVATEDDEEIDSDDAYGEADEINPTAWEKKFHKSDKNMTEESEEEEDELDGEG
ncbi:hypothetical protein DSO57_1025169 [Entomophthora muscae]|uniref:Uncharacterized protein n=1 Tax=Entomophthora muscae TaxID=34485 RepID=A0ACC2T2M7_9FUNG|nr:hypothetical protein DSO57_1025169 [Entomophthora muscae]